MLCYKDMTFCADSDQCANSACGRKFTEWHREDAIRWLGEDAPVAWSSFKDSCGMFVGVRNDER
jgi:hypothetical protein